MLPDVSAHGDARAFIPERSQGYGMQPGRIAAAAAEISHRKRR